MDAAVEETPGRPKVEQLQGKARKKVDHHHREVGNVADEIHHDVGYGTHGGV